MSTFAEIEEIARLHAIKVMGREDWPGDPPVHQTVSFASVRTAIKTAICEVLSAHRQGTVEEHREEIARRAFEAGFYARPKGDSFYRHELHGTPREFHFTPGGPAMDMCPEAWAAYKAAIADVLREVGR